MIDVDRKKSVLEQEREREAARKAGVRVHSPSRSEMKRKLRLLAAKPTAVNCPDLFAEDKEFMRLFWESKALEGLHAQRHKFQQLKNELRARGLYLESKEKSDAA